MHYSGPFVLYRVRLSAAKNKHPNTVCLRGRGLGPFLDAVQVEDVVAALAAPHWGHEPDDVAANHALVLLLRQLFNQTSCGVTGFRRQITHK